MKKTKLDERFFDSTRGQIVGMLRGRVCTVEELAGELGLTNNAVRAHLATLERDGLVEQKGIRRSFRKPHYTYSLTMEAEHLFPKAYDALFKQLITVLKGRLKRDALLSVLREVGGSLAASHSADDKTDNFKRRLHNAIKALEALGGSPRIEEHEEKVFIRSGNCPLGAAVVEHPEVCQLAEALVSEIIGQPVKERCERDESPRCCFELVDK